MEVASQPIEHEACDQQQTSSSEPGQAAKPRQTPPRSSRKCRRQAAVVVSLMPSLSPGRPPVPPCPRSILANDEALLEHQPRPRAQFLALALELAAGGENVAPARRAHRARIARVEDDLREALDRRPSPSIRRGCRATD